MICVWYMCIISNHITCTYSVLTYYVIFIIKGVNSDFCSPSLPCLRQWGSRGEPSLPLWLPRCNRIRRPSQDPLLETSEPKNSGAISKRAGVCWGHLSRSSFIICGPMSPKNKRAVKQSPWNSRPQQIQYCKRFNPQISWMKEPFFSERTFFEENIGLLGKHCKEHLTRQICIYPSFLLPIHPKPLSNSSNKNPLTFPSSSSNEAPPPVLQWVTWHRNISWRVKGVSGWWCQNIRVCNKRHSYLTWRELQVYPFQLTW